LEGLSNEALEKIKDLDRRAEERLLKIEAEAIKMGDTQDTQ
jgi:ASC-1-like (ASCH) protein